MQLFYVYKLKNQAVERSCSTSSIDAAYDTTYIKIAIRFLVHQVAGGQQHVRCVDCPMRIYIEEVYNIEILIYLLIYR